MGRSFSGIRGIGRRPGSDTLPSHRCSGISIRWRHDVTSHYGGISKLYRLEDSLDDICNHAGYARLTLCSP